MYVIIIIIFTGLVIHDGGGGVFHAYGFDQLLNWILF
jgi:hypothetical protein